MTDRLVCKKCNSDTNLNYLEVAKSGHFVCWHCGSRSYRIIGKRENQYNFGGYIYTAKDYEEAKQKYLSDNDKQNKDYGLVPEMMVLLEKYKSSRRSAIPPFMLAPVIERWIEIATELEMEMLSWNGYLYKIHNLERDMKSIALMWKDLDFYPEFPTDSDRQLFHEFEKIMAKMLES
jgi:hypothetical protein